METCAPASSKVSSKKPSPPPPPSLSLPSAAPCFSAETSASPFAPPRQPPRRRHPLPLSSPRIHARLAHRISRRSHPAPASASHRSAAHRARLHSRPHHAALDPIPTPATALDPVATPDAAPDALAPPPVPLALHVRRQIRRHSRPAHCSAPNLLPRRPLLPQSRRPLRILPRTRRRLRQHPSPRILDGEILGWNPSASAHSPSPPSQIASAANASAQAPSTPLPSLFIAFDFLYADGRILLSKNHSLPAAMPLTQSSPPPAGPYPQLSVPRSAAPPIRPSSPSNPPSPALPAPLLLSSVSHPPPRGLDADSSSPAPAATKAS